MNTISLAEQAPNACVTRPEAFAEWQRRMIAAEENAGWLSECSDAGRFLAIGRELVDALAVVLRPLAADAPVLEVCAGAGEMAGALGDAGVQVQAVDTEPADDSSVLRMSAAAALGHFRPTVVLGCFVPFDAGVDEAVLAFPSVRHYLVLNARIGGILGSPGLWRQPDWTAEPIDEVRRWMLTRHDVSLGTDLLQHGEAWLFSRTPSVHERACR